MSGCQVGQALASRGGTCGIPWVGSGKLGVTDTCQVARLVRVGPPGGDVRDSVGGIREVGRNGHASGCQVGQDRTSGGDVRNFVGGIRESGVTDTCQVVRLGRFGRFCPPALQGGRAELCVCILPIFTLRA